MTPLVFTDTETTSLRPDREVWEVAMIRRTLRTTVTSRFMIGDVPLHHADPFSLEVGRFYDRHPLYNHVEAFPPTGWRHEDYDSAFGGHLDGPRLVSARNAATRVEQWTRGATIVGAVPN